MLLFVVGSGVAAGTSFPVRLAEFRSRGRGYVINQIERHPYIEVLAQTEV